MNSNRITFATAVQAMIFDSEIKGQISDGAWENSRGTCWEQWCSLEVEVGPVAGRHCHINRTSFNLHSLIDFVGERMCEYARLALAYPECRDWSKLRTLEYRNAKWVREGTDSHAVQMRAAIAEFGGAEAINERLHALSYEYSIGQLKNDLTAIKAAMKAEVR